MYEHKLLEVEGHFQIENLGLVVLPDFPAGDASKSKSIDAEAKVVVPNGGESIHKLHISTAHFKIKDFTVGMEKRWRLVVSFPESTKTQIPKGSRVYVSAKVSESFV